MQWAERCYNSLRSSTIPCDILTIDNGSKDGTPQYIRTHFPEVEIIEQQENIGFGKANNLGLQKMLDEGYDYAYLLNQDAWIFPDTFEKLINAYNQCPEYGILSPMQVKADGKSFDDRFATNVIGIHQTTRPLFSEDFFFGRRHDVYEVSFVMAAHWFISRSCVTKVGGFSPTFFLYGEDDNYIKRAQFWQQKVGIVPSSLAIHDRADKDWDERKTIYITHYTMVLDSLSNPLGKLRLFHCIKNQLFTAIKRRDKQIWDLAIRLFKERKQIENNFNLSLCPCAFLNDKKSN